MATDSGNAPGTDAAGATDAGPIGTDAAMPAGPFAHFTVVEDGMNRDECAL